MTEQRKGRQEDLRLVTGTGDYTDDRAVDGVLFGCFVRSDMASARIQSVDIDAACNMPGVMAVFTGADLSADGVGPVFVPMKIPGHDGTEWRATPRDLLPTDRVRFLGEPLALVVAESRAQAQDAAEAVVLDLEELPAVTTIAAARADGAPLVHDDRPGNLCMTWGRGDWDAAGEAIDSAFHTVRIEVPVSRVTAVAMEPRTALAGPIGGGRMEMVCSHQNPMALRPALANAFGMEPQDIRCHNGDVGGAFGMKSGPLREECTLFWAARKLDRHVRWTATRAESFLIDEAGRDMHFTCELGMDADGTFTAMRFGVELNVGAYVSTRSAVMVANFGGAAGVYRTPLIAGRIEGYLTHTVPPAPYRGAGRPEATLAVESLIDAAARQCGFDRIDLRRRNLIPADAMPWKSPFIFDYDCGDFERIMDAGIARADLATYGQRAAASAAKGRVRGLGLAMCIETAGGLYGNPGQDVSNVELRADGSVLLAMGTYSAGSGIETVMTDLAAEALQIPTDKVEYHQGDTDVQAAGKGMGGSAGMPQGAPALQDGMAKLVEVARKAAADMLDADPSDVEYAAGTFRIAGTNHVLTLEQVAEGAAQRGIRLVGEGSFAPEAPTFPNGCHVCEVEIDPETGFCEIVSYTGVEDIGTVMNRQLAEGQVQGGVVQGLGQILCEEMVYDPADGQLLSGTFMDYAMPRASDMPPLDCGFEPVPTRINPYGAKGVGEAGTVGALAAGMSAITDAMAQLGVEGFAMPATPGRVWSALKAAEDTAA
ncbi:xanthine dehydrogenase family protein molybdopterin-binding subunit [Chachezhania antarctica]|uniref:xanthine dehydrogenase family protein molybdopterin-binding subunit n=1 Tax=Chachezhania antarctica TaxID=2340860 RepID=UPI000EB01BB1|nr:xanthine dehydrogenase family protein molybdopterin-binding subunit [Chachezhania antarctica]